MEAKATATQESSARVLGEPQEGLAENEIGVAKDEADVGATCTSVTDNAADAPASDGVRMTEAQLATEHELKMDHPYGNYGVYNLKVICPPPTIELKHCSSGDIQSQQNRVRGVGRIPNQNQHSDCRAVPDPRLHRLSRI